MITTTELIQAFGVFKELMDAENEKVNANLLSCFSGGKKRACLN